MKLKVRIMENVSREEIKEFFIKALKVFAKHIDSSEGKMSEENHKELIGCLNHGYLSAKEANDILESTGTKIL